MTNMKDIEFGVGIESEKNENNSGILTGNNNKNNEYIGKLYVSGCSIFCLIFLFTPFIVMDSIALTDTQCVNQNIPLDINLKWWIQADLAILCITLFFGSIYITLFIFIKSIYETYINTIFYTVFILTNLWTFSITIVGAIIFWKYIDISLCEKITWQYIYTLLILKLISMGITFLQGKNNDVKK